MAVEDPRAGERLQLGFSCWVWFSKGQGVLGGSFVFLGDMYEQGVPV